MFNISIENITKTFNKGTNNEFMALNNLNLNIKEQDFIVVIGGNGAGKSTLLKAIAGDFYIDSGKIIFDNLDITKEKQYKRAEYISRVFQNPFDGTAPRMTILENLLISMKRGKNRKLKLSFNKETIDFIKERVSSLNLGLENRLNTEIQLLSGGQRQIISLLMSTLSSTKLLLLDEHISALDPIMQEKVMDLTEKIIKENKLTSIMVTHKLTDALKYGNRLVIVSNGHIIKEYDEVEKKNIKIEELYRYINNF